MDPNIIKEIILQPIPPFQALTDWWSIPIIENSEEMISINYSPEEQIVLENKYYNDKVIGSISDIMVRKTVYDKLLTASKSLPHNIKLFIWDGWRPKVVQECLYQKSKDAISLANHGLDKDNIAIKAEIYAADSSKSELKNPPHSTGGAVDVSLLDNDGNPLPMGTNLDYFGEEATTNYFEKKIMQQALLENEIFYLHNRRLLYWTMINAGFTNYPHEWWHYDYGNQFWAVQNKTSAFYGIINNPNE